VSANSGQWQPGQSGNAGGRRKEKPYRDALRKVVAELATDPDPAHPKTKLEAIVRTDVRLAIGGDGPAIARVADRLDGKVPQALIGSDDPDDAPLTIQHIELVAVPPEGTLDRLSAGEARGSGDCRPATPTPPVEDGQ
jgi:hypothetical protein